MGSVFCSFGIWVRVLSSFCDFSHFLGSIVNVEDGVMLARGIHVSDTNCDSSYSVLVRVVDHKPSLQCL